MAGPSRGTLDGETANRPDVAAQRHGGVLDRANRRANTRRCASWVSTAAPRQTDGYGSAVRMPAGPPLVLMEPALLQRLAGEAEKRTT